MPTPYKQSDARWATKIVGFATGQYATFKYIGCTICDLCFLYNTVTNQDLTPDVINKRLQDKKAFVDGSILWSRVQLALPELQWVYRDHNYNNLLVWTWINVFPRLPVPVEVYKSDSVTKKHWVLYLGNQKMYDPIKGAIIATSTSGYTPATGSSRFTTL